MHGPRTLYCSFSSESGGSLSAYIFVVVVVVVFFFFSSSFLLFLLAWDLPSGLAVQDGVLFLPLSPRFSR